MGMKSRNKGKTGEREVIVILQPVVTEVYEAHGLEPPKLQRNTLQSDGGGSDIAGLAWLALEVKYQETIQLRTWWMQTLAQCGQHQTPVLFFRRNKVEWKVRLFATLAAGPHAHAVPVVVELADFLRWFRERLSYELSKGVE